MEKIYDKNGKKIGYKDKDFLGNDAIYDNDGKKQGTFKKDILGNDAYFDSDGHEVGYFSKDFFGNDSLNDPYGGAMQGSFRKDFFGNDAYYDTVGNKIAYTKNTGSNNTTPEPISTNNQSLTGNQYSYPQSYSQPDSRYQSQPSSGYASNKLYKSFASLNVPRDMKYICLQGDQLKAYFIAAAQALQKAGIPFDINTTTTKTEAKIVRYGFLNRKQKTVYEEKIIPGEDGWCIQYYYDNYDSDDGHNYEDETRYVLTISGKMLRKKDSIAVPIIPNRLYCNSEGAWEHTTSMERELDFYLKNHGIALSSLDFEGWNENKKTDAIQQNTSVNTTVQKAESVQQPVVKAEPVKQEIKDVPSLVLDQYNSIKDRASFKEIRQKGNDGNKLAQIITGLCYLTGRCINQNISMGLNKISSAAHWEEPFALYLLGFINDRKLFGLPGTNGMHWYYLASEHGNEAAIKQVEELYKNHDIELSAAEIKKIRDGVKPETEKEASSRLKIEDILLNYSNYAERTSDRHNNNIENKTKVESAKPSKQLSAVEKEKEFQLLNERINKAYVSEIMNAGKKIGLDLKNAFTFVEWISLEDFRRLVDTINQERAANNKQPI